MKTAPLFVSVACTAIIYCTQAAVPIQGADATRFVDSVSTNKFFNGRLEISARYATNQSIEYRLVTTPATALGVVTNRADGIGTQGRFQGTGQPGASYSSQAQIRLAPGWFIYAESIATIWVYLGSASGAVVRHRLSDNGPSYDRTAISNNDLTNAPAAFRERIRQGTSP